MPRRLRIALEIPTFALSPPSGGDRSAGFVEARCSALDRLLGVVKAAEEAGFDALFLSDPSAPSGQGAGSSAAPSSEPPAAVDPLPLAGLLARHTSSILVGVVATASGGRHPSVVAREITTVDQLAGGRSALLFEAGHSGDPQVDIETVSEAATILKSLCADGPSTFAGQHYWVAGAVNLPPPWNPEGPLLVVDPGPDTATANLGAVLAVNADVLAARDLAGVARLAGADDDPVSSEPGARPAIVWRGTLPFNSSQASSLLGGLAGAGASGVVVRLAGLETADGLTSAVDPHDPNKTHDLPPGEQVRQAYSLLSEVFPLPR